jgi:hypothetical protein
MAAYYTNEGAFDLPEVGFEDRTVHVFEAELRGEDELGLIICRTKMPEGKSLRDVVAAHVTQEAKRLGGYSILEERETLRAGVPAIEVFSRWRHEGKVVYQRQAHLGAPGLWLLFAMSAPLADRDHCDRTMEHILTSFRLHDAG